MAEVLVLFRQGYEAPLNPQRRSKCLPYAEEPIWNLERVLRSVLLGQTDETLH